MEKVFIKKLDKEIEIDSWLEVNKIAAKALKNFIINNSHGSEIIKTEINEDGFAIDFLTEKNVSENSLPLFTGKIKKELGKDIEVDSELPSSMIKELILRGVSGLTLKDGQNGNRIFGFATLTKEEFNKKLIIIEDREQRDHRKVGKALELFYIDEGIGKGLPMWLPNGVILKKVIKDYIWAQEEKYGSMQVETPVIGSSDIYKTSGHYYHYKDGMFPEMVNQEGEEFFLRPMSCPHHALLYRSQPRSYKDLPFRVAENVKMYRYEKSGALIGLERVRAMELTDSHIFLTSDQLEEELEKGFSLIQETLNKFEIEIDYIELALHDSVDTEKYHGDKELWTKSETLLKDFLEKKGVKYIALEGEAAFYGPKIDVQIKTALGHKLTVSTIQLDFLLPERFNLSYIDKNNEKQIPIMIHRGLIGTFERFIATLLEQTKGDLPMWLAPQQAVVIPVNNEAHFEYCRELVSKLKEAGVRVKLDSTEERLSKKIRIHQQSKVKTQIIIGDEEVNNKTVSYRFYGSEDTTTLSIDEIVNIYK